WRHLQIGFPVIGVDDLAVQADELQQDMAGVRLVLRLPVIAHGPDRRVLFQWALDIPQAQHVLLERYGLQLEPGLAKIDGADVIQVLVHDRQPVVEGVRAGFLQARKGEIAHHRIVLHDRLDLCRNIFAYLFEDLGLGLQRTYKEACDRKRQGTQHKESLGIPKIGKTMYKKKFLYFGNPNPFYLWISISIRQKFR